MCVCLLAVIRDNYFRIDILASYVLALVHVGAS